MNALQDVNVVVEPGEIVGLIGPNGAGKTTLLNALSGFQQPSSGRVCLDGSDVTGTPAHRFASLGLTRSFQGCRLFPRLTVRENVEAAAIGVGMKRRAARELAAHLLARADLTPSADTFAADLPAGDQRLLGLVRAVAGRPRYLLLDEPAAGLNDDESVALVSTMSDVRDDVGCAILIVEHDMRVIMPLCERIYVLDHGRVLAEGSAAEIRSNPAVVEAYLGVVA
ncbi:ABC transporter ATP-binding protein [Mycobacterium aquaticum]|uniref:ABC transporter ATP-binding protein n=1 Tax=Mycobacterium aquaticum TaxID=1927124 RepID=UPI001FEC21A5|nr:ABC transporter ATP-binding protein [Mycobacterium aquaticum]